MSQTFGACAGRCFIVSQTIGACAGRCLIEVSL